MYPEVMAREQAELDLIARDHAIRIATLAGLDNPAEKVELEVPATIRFGDAALYALMLNKARSAVVEESLRKLEGGKSEPAFDVEYPQVPPDGQPESADPQKLEDIDGIGPKLAQELEEQGYESPEDLRKASDEELLAVDGIGKSNLERIRKDVG